MKQPLRVNSCLADGCDNPPVSVAIAYRQLDGQKYQLPTCEEHQLLREQGDYVLTLTGENRRAVLVTDLHDPHFS